MSIRAVDEVPQNEFHPKLTWACAGGPFLDGYLLSIDLAVLVDGSVLSVFATETWQFVVLRFVLGMAIGADCWASSSWPGTSVRRPPVSSVM